MELEVQICNQDDANENLLDNLVITDQQLVDIENLIMTDQLINTQFSENEIDITDVEQVESENMMIQSDVSDIVQQLDSIIDLEQATLDQEE